MLTLLFVLATALPPTGREAPSPRAALGAPTAADRAREAWLCRGRIRRLRVSPYGGTAIKVMLRFGPGRRAVFKPAQRLWSARYQAEIVAYRLSRLLHVQSVPPACERRIPLGHLERLYRAPRHAARLARLRAEVMVESDGKVPGAAIYFVPRAHELDLAGNSPWQRWLRPGARIPQRWRRRAGELSDLLLLDLLFSNPDRFSGGNVLIDLATGRLLMIDNGASFRPRPRLTLPYHRKALAHLGRVRRPTYQALRALDARTLARAVARPNGGAAYLTAAEQRALLRRRAALIAHVEALVRRHGAAAVFLP